MLEVLSFTACCLFLRCHVKGKRATGELLFTRKFCSCLLVDVRACAHVTHKKQALEAARIAVDVHMFLYSRGQVVCIAPLLLLVLLLLQLLLVLR